MNHDYTHCADFTEYCPRGCFRAQLVRDLQRFGKLAPYGINFPISWTHFKGTEECKKKEPIGTWNGRVCKGDLF